MKTEIGLDKKWLYVKFLGLTHPVPSEHPLRGGELGQNPLLGGVPRSGGVGKSQ